MKRLIMTAVLMSLLLTGICLMSVVRSSAVSNPTEGYAVKLNEIQQLAEAGDSGSAAKCAEELRADMRRDTSAASDNTVPVMCGICLVFIWGAVVYFRFSVAEPFMRLKDFAERVALGDLDTPLEYERTNLFGKFSWAFDSMRQEITRARACEREAIENNKTVIASLSHDIKTPVSSIRAYAEALEMGMDAVPEKRGRYISTIIRKCDEVAKLTEDMLTHSLTELGRLRICPERIDLNSTLTEILADISADGDVCFEKPMFDVEINADRERLAQLAENIVSNARKYAKTKVKVTVTRDERMAYLHFRDYGGGIPNKDMPFVFGKFYRGKNTENEKGAGLGLYIVKYIAEGSGGSVSLRNCSKGLEVTVALPICK